MRRARWPIAIALIAFLGAIVGVYAGRTLFPARQSGDSEIHRLLHDDLKLDADQQARLAALEKSFEVRRLALESELRVENARIADAIEAERRNGPRVNAAVDASHRSMGELQKATLAHVFAMRQILRPDQVEPFDRAVVHSLTADGR